MPLKVLDMFLASSGLSANKVTRSFAGCDCFYQKLLVRSIKAAAGQHQLEFSVMKDWRGALSRSLSIRGEEIRLCHLKR